MIFTFGAEKNDVHFYMNTEFDVDKPTLIFSYPASCPVEALMIRDYLERECHDFMERIRRGNYEQGYNDGRRKKRKRNWFYTSGKLMGYE